jgi:hypothetical protein
VCILDVCCVFYSIISTHGYGDSMYGVLWSQSGVLWSLSGVLWSLSGVCVEFEWSKFTKGVSTNIQ